LHAGDLLQMTEAGLPVWKLLSEALGKPVSEIRKLSEQGKLMTADVLPKLEAQMHKDYGGAMAKQSQTLSGLWSTLMDTFHQGLGDALLPMEPMLRKVIPTATRVMGEAFKGLGEATAAFFDGISGHVTRAEAINSWTARLGLGIRALVEAFKNGSTGSDGFIGAMEHVGVALHHAWDRITFIVSVIRS
jgi:hypothetical protein